MLVRLGLRNNAHKNGTGKTACRNERGRAHITTWIVIATIVLGTLVLAAFVRASPGAAGPFLAAQAIDDRSVYLPIVARVIASPSPSPTLRPSPTPTIHPVQQRFGVNYIGSHGSLLSYNIERVPFGWYSDYSFHIWPQPSAGREYVQMVPVDSRYYTMDWEVLRAAIQNNPGALWIVGNEPECPMWPQPNLTPEDYAWIYYTYYTFIKAVDPNAQVAIGGVVEPTPLRLQWLDKVWQRYQSRHGVPMPVDVWNIHNMIIEERRGTGAGIPAGIDATEGQWYHWTQSTDIEIFKAHIVAFRQWMNNHGQRNKPLIISEYGVVFPCSWWDTLDPPGCIGPVTSFMDATFDYMLNATDSKIGYPADGNHLVQKWSWFSLNGLSYEQDSIQGFNGSLFDPLTEPKQLTPFGVHYEQTLNRFLGRVGAPREP